MRWLAQVIDNLLNAALEAERPLSICSAPTALDQERLDDAAARRVRRGWKRRDDWRLSQIGHHPVLNHQRKR